MTYGENIQVEKYQEDPCFKKTLPLKCMARVGGIGGGGDHYIDEKMGRWL